jgi:alpha,alpha-trehalase
MIKETFDTGKDLLKASLVQVGAYSPIHIEPHSPDELLGELFSDVQINQVYPDGKTFVDLVPKERIHSIQQEYQLLKQDPHFDLREFIKRHFYDIAETTHKPKPYRFSNKKSINQHVDDLWEHLERRNRIDRGSLLALPYKYIVPGGRFNEQFYWDSYFIMLGLAASGRWQQVEEMLKNCAYMIRKYGFIPTANRSYFLSRSQPPFFSHMVRLLAEHKGRRVLVEYLPLMLAEYKFWMRGQAKITDHAYMRVVKLSKNNILNRYYDNKSTPRPESLRQDTATAGSTKANKEKLFLDLRAAAESGWDFSSRWFTNPNDIQTIATTDIIPVDLNVLLYHLELTIADAYKLLLQPLLVRKYTALAARRKELINKYCWDETAGFFVDYNFRRGRSTGVLSLASVVPLFTGLASQDQAEAVAKKLEKDFLKAGGLVTTLTKTGQQWDAPNGWAPLEYMAIKGLERYGHHELAETIARRWTGLNQQVYSKTYRLVEKYNVMDDNGLGSGGEYLLQDGFGWTNGVYLALTKDLQNKKTND